MADLVFSLIVKSYWERKYEEDIYLVSEYCFRINEDGYIGNEIQLWNGLYIYIYIYINLTIHFIRFQITYHEVEPSGFEQNADSSSIYVAEEYFSLSNLQPGRNYSISVQAVSKGIESVQRSLFQATRKYRYVERGSKCHHFQHNNKFNDIS